MPVAHLRGPGHPDALCDAMAIALTVEHLRRDPDARMRLCVTGGRENVFVDGDLVSTADFDPVPILRQAISEVDPALAVEPFVTSDAVLANYLPLHSAFEPCLVYGYATSETSDGWPLARHMAGRFVRALEQLRTEQEDGYILGSDYDVLADDTRREITVRLEHLPTADRTLVQRLVGLSLEGLTGWTARFLASGSVPEAGLRRRSGVSGRSEAALVYSSHIPSSGSGVGSALRHPANLGHWLARAAAKRLVAEGRGRGVLAVLRWDPFETRPTIVSVRNEKGEDLSAMLDPQAFDLAAAHSAYADPMLLMRAFRQTWKEDAVLPWETI